MTYQAQFGIPYAGLLPGDVCVNTFHFEWLGGGTPSQAALDLLQGNLVIFYQSIYSNTSGALELASYAANTLCRLKVYNLEDPSPRVPVRDATINLTATKATSTIIPPEAAVVLSFHTEFVSGAPRASQRGRIYIGMLGGAGVTPGSGGAFPRISDTTRTYLGNTCKSLASNSLADQWGWVIYSRKLDQSFAVAGGWVDDALDTQRRRGQAATVRTVWSD